MNLRENRALVDISTVSVNIEFPQNERIAEYNRQIRDPHHFISGELEMRAFYPKNAPKLESLLSQITVLQD